MREIFVLFKWWEGSIRNYRSLSFINFQFVKLLNILRMLHLRSGVLFSINYNHQFRTFLPFTLWQHLVHTSIAWILTCAFCFFSQPLGHAQWSVTNPEWGHNWMVVNNLIPNMEYELRLTAINDYGDRASSTLYQVKTQARKGNTHSVREDK